ncbi:hypothetical protein LWI29_007102 [Acer saccharum]|uniref:Uncharacterized protein n=1 Tax=Acer saccharum TaxID=4024 RepID=A0AA39W8Z9_ACESA|nr:hypothetical protein LWI29_007102 [Acer saccharum]
MSLGHFIDDETDNENPNHDEYGSEPESDPKEDYKEPDSDNDEDDDEPEPEPEDRRRTGRKGPARTLEFKSSLFKFLYFCYCNNYVDDARSGPRLTFKSSFMSIILSGKDHSAQLTTTILEIVGV